MKHTIDSILNDEVIERYKKTIDGYSIWLKGIDTEIKIQLTYNGECGGFNFCLSHAIKTPEQAGPYITSRPWAEEIEYALYRAICSITDHYKNAINKGHRPTKQWLIENKYT
jgi:hypothetical protein